MKSIIKSAILFFVLFSGMRTIILLERVYINDAKGDVVCTQDQVFTHLRKEPERLNNLVCRLKKGEIKFGKSEKQEIIFENPRNGWIWVKVGTDSGGEGVVIIGEGDKEWMKIAGGKTETMRWLTRGTHSLTVSATTGSKVDYEIRSVPELILDTYDYSPYDNNFLRRPFLTPCTFGPYAEKYLKETGILRDINGIMARGSRTQTEAILRENFAGEWVRNGRRWFACDNPPGYNGPDNIVTPEYAFKVWSENPVLTNNLISGWFIDEFTTSVTEPGWSAHKLMGWLGGMKLMLADRRFKDKAIYPYASPNYSRRAPDDISFVAGLIDIGTRPSFEWYPCEEPTEEATEKRFNEFKSDMRAYKQNIPGLLKHSLFVLCFASVLGAGSCDTRPDVDYKVFLDMQFNMIVNYPLFRDLGGIQWYSSGYADDETMRWGAALFRHYCIEGRTGKLSERYGFKYKLQHIANGDFEKGLKGWQTRTGAKGTLTLKKIDGYGCMQERHDDRGVGNHILWMKRTTNGPNVIAQVVKGLEEGRLYSLKMLSGDYGELMSGAGKSMATNHGLRVDIENVEVIPDESFVGIVASKRTRYGFDAEKNPYYFNYHWTVFRAKGKEAKLAISDWADEKNAEGPAGQELICNFIQIQPYFAKEQYPLE